MPRLRRSDCSGPGISRHQARARFLLRRRGRHARCATPRRSSASGPWPSRPPGATCGSAPTRAATCRPPASTPPGASSTATTTRWRARRDRAEVRRDARLRPRAAAAAPRASRATCEATAPAASSVLACAVRLLDLGFFRIGSRGLRRAERAPTGWRRSAREHVRIVGDEVDLRLPRQERAAPRAGDRRPRASVEVIEALKRRRGGPDELLAYRDERRWDDVRSDDINEYLKRGAGAAVTAKDFRTWNGTVLAAVALARARGPAAARRTRASARSRRRSSEVADLPGQHAGGRPHAPTSTRA